MAQPLSIMNVLKEACNQPHLQVRAGFYAQSIMDKSLSLPQYKVLVLANYFFHQGLEGQIARAVPDFLLDELEFSSRVKSVFAQKDLAELGLLSLIECFRPQASLTLNGLPEAIGALYVLEGTAIGGAIIRKNLIKNPEIATNSSIHFFGCYGEKLSERWKAFAKILEGLEWEAADQQRAIHTAKATFVHYEAVIREMEGNWKNAKMPTISQHYTF